MFIVSPSSLAPVAAELAYRRRAFDRESSNLRSIVAAGDRGSAAQNPIGNTGFVGIVGRETVS
jgi:hypothetical protein